MDWSNRFTLAGFTVTYCTFQMAWEVIEKKGDYEVAFRWFSSKKKAEAFAMKKLATALDLNTKAVEQTVSLLRTNGGR